MVSKMSFGYFCPKKLFCWEDFPVFLTYTLEVQDQTKNGL